MKFNRKTRFYFLIDNKKFYFDTAPIGWDEVEQDIKRSKTSDGIVLDITQNLKFVKDARKKLIDEYFRQGVDGKVKLVRQVKEENNWVTKNTGYVSFSTLTWDKTTATVDFVKNDFDAVFRDNFKEDFELDRTTDINGNDISELEREILIHRSRKIFLRSQWKIDESYVVSPTFSTDRLVTPRIENFISSDPDTSSVLRNLVINPTLSTDISADAIFLLNSTRNKTINITVDINAEFNNYDTAQVQIYKYENGTNYDYVSTTNVSGVFSSGADVIYNGTVEMDVQEGESLILGIYVDPGVHTTQVTINSCNVTQTEDSFFDPLNVSERNIDCIGLFNAFTRITEILDPNVIFKSDFLENEWPGLCITSGESIRHLYYKDEETDEETIAPLLTTSFEKLYKALFTIAPVGYGIRQEGKFTILEVEDIEYFFDREEAIEVGNLTGIERSVNEDKTYSRIEIGYTKSGKNEEVAGLYAVNTVNTYLLPANTVDNTYDATNDFRSDCNEVEMCFRKQYSLFPDEDTQYDKDTFIFDCSRSYSINQQNFVYRSWTYVTFYDDIYGVYDKTQYYNIRISPMNCLLRHGKNFKQEYMKDFYEDIKTIYYEAYVLPNPLDPTYAAIRFISGKYIYDENGNTIRKHNINDNLPSHYAVGNAVTIYYVNSGNLIEIDTGTITSIETIAGVDYAVTDILSIDAGSYYVVKSNYYLSVQYASTNGNSNFSSTIIGGVERFENGNVLISDFDDAMYTNLLIEGEGVALDSTIDSINAGDPKPNYLKTFVWIDEYGNKQKAFGYDIKIGDKIKYELVERYR